MNKYYKKLELDKILDLLAEQTYSDACREKALKLKPSFDEEEIRTELKKTDDAFKLSAKFGTPRFRKIKDLSMSLRRCKSGSALSFRELLDVADILREEMSGAARLSVPLTVDAKIGHSWAEAH